MNRRNKSQLLRWFIVITIITTINLACGTPKTDDLDVNNTTPPETEALTSFPIPIPPTILKPEQQATYIATHYWDSFDFADTSLVARPEITEQGFVDFVNVLKYVDKDVRNKTIVSFLSKAQSADSLMFHHFLRLAEDYMYNPISQYRCDEQYAIVLNYIISSPKIADINKVRPRYLLRMVMKNRVDNIANDFHYKLKNKTVQSLHNLKANHILLFFNTPNCGYCVDFENYIASSEPINRLLNAKQLTILSIYPDKDIAAWQKHEYPKQWINAYNPKQTILNNELYNLKAIPTLYLLDKDKKVVLKDAPVEQIEAYLNEIVL